MKTRAKSALLMAPILILVFLGGYFLIAGVFVLTLYALKEFADAFGDKKPASWVFWASTILLYAGYLMPQIRSYIILPWIFISIVMCFLSMFSVEKRDLTQGLATFLGVFYIIFLAFHLVLVDESFRVPLAVTEHFTLSGLQTYVWVVVLSAFGTDMFAYFTGMAIGSRKLCPKISPKKTVEGAIGGVLGSVLLCGLFGFFFLPLGFANCIVIGIVGGVTSQLGDLSASVMKRKIGIKDWSSLIPGHGGLLDRLDSILFTAPTVFYILMLKAVLFGGA
ncbi:MAG: phosphatidate cytidylyltransferase [Clostridiales Family XIII bacterium]|jgi:phosphatidate cytidylyltransferase|nr:phosphatidate cytidylyltransferase [Clostridiales Family XIII bacterium]